MLNLALQKLVLLLRRVQLIDELVRFLRQLKLELLLGRVELLVEQVLLILDVLLQILDFVPQKIVLLRFQGEISGSLDLLFEQRVVKVLGELLQLGVLLAQVGFLRLEVFDQTFDLLLRLGQLTLAVLHLLSRAGQVLLLRAQQLLQTLQLYRQLLLLPLEVCARGFHRNCGLLLHRAEVRLHLLEIDLQVLNLLKFQSQVVLIGVHLLFK